MTHRVKKVRTLENFVVSVVFQNGTAKEYDVKTLFLQFPQFGELQRDEKLWKKVKVDEGGYGISWNDNLDLSSEELWDNGKTSDRQDDVDIFSLVGAEITRKREQVGLTQKELAEKTGIYQADISKIERGKANPSLQTLNRLAEGIDTTLHIELKNNMEKNVNK